MRVGGHELIGEILDRRYRVDAPIARGGMSTVFRGLDTRLDRPVAIKVMDPKFAADPAFLARFEFEARAVARLKHPGLVAVYDQGLDGELAFLVMELVEGGTLRELLRERGPMPPHAVRAVAEPVLDALGVAHAAGLVHRDIKPENVLISDTGEVKLADFGLVRAVAASTTTSSSVILGTAAYLSPEQVATGSADARSDVYAMGVLIFEMLTGTTPFSGDTSLSVAYQRLNADVPSPSAFIPGVPPLLDEFVLDATAREPGHRYPDAIAMAASLRVVAKTLELPAYRVPAPQRSAEHASAQVRPPADAPPRKRPFAEHDAPTTVNRAPSTGTAVFTAQPPPAAPDGFAHHTRVVTAPTTRHAEVEPAGPAPAEHAGYRFPDFVEEQHKSRRTTIVWLLIVLALALAVGIGGWWMGSGRYTAVPAIDGLDRAAAAQAISSAGLTTEIRPQNSDTVPIDVLIGTDPPAGSRVAKNSTVALLVSLGRPKVPDLRPGEDIALVQNRLREASLQPVDGGETFSTTAPLGTVAALDPKPGTVVAVGSPVKVIRSKGAPPVSLPNLNGKSVDEARRTLEAAGITVGQTTQAFDAAVDAGNVIRTDPPVGTTVPAGTEVTLVTSNAVKVPSLVGHSVGTARDQLDELGLGVTVRQVADTDRSLVFTQLPGAGTRVQPGSTVTIISLP